MHVTVLMAAYNEEASVAEAIESIREQTHAEWDLVVVNDASTDASGVILEQEAKRDARIHVIHHERNRGLAVSLNEALRRAGGELVARMDADDVSFPTRFEKQVAFLEENPDVDVLGTWAELVDEEGTVIGVAERPSDHVEIVRRFPRENPLIHPSIMARRSFFMALDGYDETLRRAQDMDLWTRGLGRFRYANLTEPLIRYRIPKCPDLSTIAYGAWVILRAGWRTGRPIVFGWYATRFLVAGLAARTNRYSPWSR